MCDKEILVYHSKWRARAVAVLKAAHNLDLDYTVPNVYAPYDSFWLYIPLEIVKPVHPASLS